MINAFLLGLTIITVLLGIVIFASVFFYPSGIRFQFVSAGRAVENLLCNGKVAKLIQEFGNLGFANLGVFSEETLFGKALSITSASEQARSFGLIRKQGAKIIYSFYTPFVGGEVLLTANGYFPRIRKQDCLIEAIPGSDVEKLFATHNKRLQALTAGGSIPFDAFTQASRMDAARLFYSKWAVRRWMSSLVLKTMLLGAFVVFVLPFAAVLAFILATTIDLRSPEQRFGWETYPPAQGAFSVLMPRNPSVASDGYRHTIISEDGRFTYVVSYFDYSRDVHEIDPNILLNEFQNTLLEKGGTLVVGQDIALGQYKGREFRIRESDETIPFLVEGRVYLAGQRVYRVYVRYSMPDGLSDKIKAFLDSFRILDAAAVPGRQTAGMLIMRNPNLLRMSVLG
jgi:hypothetical protein